MLVLCMEREQLEKFSVPSHAIPSYPFACRWCWQCVCVIMCLLLPLLYHSRHIRTSERRNEVQFEAARGRPHAKAVATANRQTGLCRDTFGLLSLPASLHVTAVVE